MKTIFLFFSLLSSMLLAQESWPMQGGNPQHTGLIDRSIGVISPSEVWFANKDTTSSTPFTSLIACSGGGKIFTTERDVRQYKIVARSLNTGDVLWQKYFPPSSKYAAPSYSEGKIYFQHTNNDRDSQLYCLNASDGKILWDQSFRTQWSSFLPPTISNDVVYVQEGSYGGVAAYNKDTGEKLFFTSLPQVDSWTP